MGNENERKRNPAENRQRQMGHPFDEAKTGGDEETVGVANDPGFGEGGGPTSTTVGTVGIIGGSADFLTDGEEPTGQGSTGGPVRRGRCRGERLPNRSAGVAITVRRTRRRAAASENRSAARFLTAS